MKTLAIIGAGQLGIQIAHYAISDKHFDTVVFFDDITSENEVKGHLVLGTTNDIGVAFKKNKFNELLIGIGYKHLKVRKELFEKWNTSIPFATLIHSSSWVDSKATVEKGCVIYPGCLIDAHSIVKSNTLLNIGCVIAHDTEIGSHSFLSPHAAIAGFVEVGECCILGINSTVIDNIKIIDNTQIGAGTIVIKSIKKSGLYVGNPAKFVR